jgi:hypothetical protein
MPHVEMKETRKRREIEALLGAFEQTPRSSSMGVAWPSSVRSPPDRTMAGGVGYEMDALARTLHGNDRTMRARACVYWGGKL